MEVNYYLKYLKYKNKYITYKNELYNINGGKSLNEKSFEKLLVFIKRAGQSVPGYGTALTMMNLVISAGQYYNDLMNIMKNYYWI